MVVAMKSAVAVSVAVVVALMVLGGSQAQQSCSSELNNLNVCVPFVVPGATNTEPNAECCGALQAVERDCFCNTMRIASRLPSQCNLPPLVCGN